jgi:tRNA U34 2-thiouridine synthase MnmA/TrmU
MKAIVLISGGLDSILASRLIKEQGIGVLPVNFKLPFIKNHPSSLALDNLGKELETIDISGDFLKLLESPEHGFGSNMNPCIDCKILMLKKAKEMMQALGAAFVVTGEVLGQRPMSQHKWALNTIAKNSGLDSLVVRPLSARLLPETIPEKEGWIKRDKLLDFNGRGRLGQIRLAKEFGIKGYAQPAGGCLLTDPEFSKRLKDIMLHRQLNAANVELLKLGRHFRISSAAKLVVGRNERENKKLESLAEEGDYLFYPCAELAGPTSLGRGEFSEDLIQLACAITCRYCDLNGAGSADIIYRRVSKKGTVPERDSPLRVVPVEEHRLTGLHI